MKVLISDKVDTGCVDILQQGGLEVDVNTGLSVEELLDIIGGYAGLIVRSATKVTEAVIRIFHRSEELRKNRMKARIKFLIARIGIDEFRAMVEEELRGQWAQKSFDPTPLLFIEDESQDTSESPPGGYHMNGHLPEFERWLQTNVHPQKQQGYKAVTVKLPLGDIQAEQFHHI